MANIENKFSHVMRIELTFFKVRWIELDEFCCNDYLSYNFTHWEHNRAISAWTAFGHFFLQILLKICENRSC